MTDGNDDTKTASGRKPLTLTRNVGAGTVRQSFSHGRSKAVVVEMKKKRVIGTPSAPGTPGAAPSGAGAVGGTGLTRSGATLGLSADEVSARTAALERAKADENARRERERLEAENRARLLEAERRKMEEERKAAELEAQRRADEAERRRLAEEALAARRAAGDASAVSPPPPEPEPEPEPEAAAEEANALLTELGGRVKKQKGVSVAPKPVSRTRGEPIRRAGRLTVVSAMTDDGDRQRSLASVRRAREKERERRMKMMRGQDSGKIVRDVVIPEAITIADLANRMAERVTDVIKFLMREGTMATQNDVLDADMAELIVAEFGHNAKRVAESDVETGLVGADDDDVDKITRAPVVTIMGHVDHGKTSLLDAIRNTTVVSGESGGITQHIGAYQVKLPGGEKVTFLDTPGHAAFSAMRARGANLTDIVVLVVAADDGVMPQTIEAISHAKASGVPIIVAVNKIDKYDAEPQKVLNELLQHDIITEEVGGDTLWVPVSALKKTNLDKLLETILLQAELLDLKANPNRSGEGVVIEAQLDKGKGPVATVLVHRGSLKRGDIVVAGAQWGKVRALNNERGQQVPKAGPSEPVEILGLDGAPSPGDPVAVVESEARAREITDYRQRLKRDKSMVPVAARTSLETMLAKIKDQDVRELPIVLKADVQGSAEAIVSSIDKLATSEVRGRVIHQGVGGITESDVLLAKATGAPIVGFNVRASKQARDLAEHENVEIRYYSVIYDLIDDVKGVLSGMLAPITRETFLGNAKILQVFQITKTGKVAGCRVTEGVVRRGAKVRLLRDDVVIHEGTLSTLKRFKEEVTEVGNGVECGMAFQGYQDIREGDFIECFSVETVARTLD